MKKIDVNKMERIGGKGAGLCLVATIGVSVFLTPVAGMYTGLACWMALEYN